MILSLAVTITVGLFLGQIPASTDALSTRQGPVDYQGMKDGAALSRRNFFNFPSKFHEEEGSYETGGQYDQSGSYSSTGSHYGDKEDSYDAGKDYYSSGSGKNDYDPSKTKDDAAYKDETPGYKSSYGSSSGKDSYKNSDPDGKNSGKYDVINTDKKTKDSQPSEYYDSTQTKPTDPISNNWPTHVEHTPISVPPPTKKDDYGNDKSEYKSLVGKKGQGKSDPSDGQVTTAGGDNSYAGDKKSSQTDQGYGKKEKDNYA